MRYERSRGREQALQILFQSEVTGESVPAIIEEGSFSEETGALDDFARDLTLGVDAHRDDIDAEISRISENWSLSRMSIVDRNVLRIAFFELCYDDEIPASVAINEAVELAKTYGDDDSSKFVNGILGRAAREHESGSAVADVADAEEVVAASDAPTTTGTADDTGAADADRG